MGKTVIYTIRVNGQDKAIKDAKDWKDAIRQTNKELLDTAIRVGRNSDEYKALQNRLTRLKDIQRTVQADSRAMAAEQRRAAKEAENAARAPIGYYRQLQAQLTSLKNTYKSLSEAELKGVGGAQLRDRISNISGELKKLDRGLGDNFRNVGNYQSAFSGLANTISGGLLFGGAVAGAQALTGALKDGIRTFIDFRDALQILGGISGASAEELKRLEEDAKRLGETTQFTAREVVDLQTNFARVGFNTDEIIAATEATINLAIATGEDLVKSSDTVAATLGGYQLAAGETSRVTDVMAASFNATALGLENFGDATKFVAPIATQAGVTIEQTTAAIGALSDAGLRGSVAGTSLRRVFSELNNESSGLSKRLGITVTDADSFNEAMRRLGKENISTADAIQLVGRYASSGFLVLANNTDKVLGLSAALANTAGTLDEVGLSLEDVPEKFARLSTAAEVAKRVQDSIAGDVKGLSSAVEALKIGFVSNFEGALRAVVQFGTSLVRGIRQALQFVVNAFRPVVDAVGEFISALGIGSDSGRVFQAVLNFLAGVVTYLANSLGTAIRSFTGYIKALKDTAGQSKFLTGVFQGFRDIVLDIIDVISDLPNYLNGLLEAGKKLKENFAGGNFFGGLKDIGTAFTEGVKASKKATEELAKESKRQEDLYVKQGAAIRKVFNQIAKQSKGPADTAARLKILSEATGVSVEKLTTEYNKFLAKLNELSEDATPEAVSAFEALQKKQKDLQDQIEDAALAGEDFTELLAEYNKVTAELQKVSDQTKNLFDKNKSLVEGSIDFLEDRLQKLRANLEKQVDSNEIKKTLEEIASKEKELAKVRGQIELIREEIDRADNIVVGELLGLGLEKDVAAESVRQLDELDTRREKSAGKEIERLEKQRARQLAAIDVQISDEQKLAEARRKINEAADIAILEQRLRTAEIGSEEYLKLEQEIAERRRAGQKADYDETREQRTKIANFVTGSVQDVADYTFRLSEATAQREKEEKITKLEEEYEKRIELAEGNEALQDKLREELDKKKQRIEKAEAEKARRRAITQAIINTALAVTSAIATVQPLIPAGIIAAASAAAAGAFQIATIRKQKFARGGYTGSGQPGAGADETGHKPVGVVHANEYVMPADVLNTAEGKELAYRAERLRIRNRPSRVRGSRRTGFAEGGPTTSIPLPTGRAGGVTNVTEVTVTLSDDDVDRITDAVKAGSAAGAEVGTARGIQREDRVQERRRRQETNINI